MLYIMYKIDKYLTIRDVAGHLSLSVEMVYKLAQKGELPAIRIGSSWRIPKEEFEAWLQSKLAPLQKAKWSQGHQQIIQDFLQRLREHYGPRLNALYVYGSYARGEATMESDLDTLVVLKEVHNKWLEMRNIRKMAYDISFGRGKNIVVSSHLVSQQEFQTRHDPLFWRIREEGLKAA